MNDNVELVRVGGVDVEANLQKNERILQDWHLQHMKKKKVYNIQFSNGKLTQHTWSVLKAIRSSAYYISQCNISPLHNLARRAETAQPTQMCRLESLLGLQRQSGP